jgi:hypothetical protein
MKWNDGSKFEGLWKDDKRKNGRMTMADGTKYSGEFEDDKYHGLGTLTMKLKGSSTDTKSFTGYFHEGKAP